MTILKSDNLRVYFKQKGRTVKALDGVDIILKAGATTAVAGESGCGKTTFAKSVLGFYKPQAGSIYYNESDITKRENEPTIRKNIQIVFQNPFLSIDPRYTVFSTLFETISVFKKIDRKTAKEKIIKALQEVELSEDVLESYPHQLSGGQIQRVCIARSLINQASLVVLDEPTSSLDVTTASKIIELLKKLQKQHNMTFLFISHDLKLLQNIAQDCFIMYYGKIVESGPIKSVYNNPLHPYTKLLMEAAQHKLKSIGEYEIPTVGCPFYPRCSQRMSECRGGYVKKEPESGHFVYCNLYK